MSSVDLSSLNEAQYRIATDFDQDLFVEAGAGSGKTFTLTQRIAWALSPGSGAQGKPFIDDLQQLLVITFTDAAAREIKERVRSTLRKSGLYEAALGVDESWISTIHGMCARLIKRHALDLGVDPSFSICTPNEAENLFNRAIDRIVGSRMKQASTELERECFEDLGYMGIVDRVEGLIKVATSSERGFESISFPRAESLEEALIALEADFVSFAELDLTEAAQASINQCLNAFKLFHEELQAMGLADLSGDRKVYEHNRAFFDSADKLIAGCKLPRASKATAESLSELRNNLEHCRLLVGLARYRRYAPILLEMAQEIDRANLAEKLAVSKLDNDDLISLALKLLETPDVARAYQGRFRLVMVDEFQDTDIRQLRLVRLLSSDPQTVLVTVGDSQQSIYRFRGADVELFQQHGASIDKAGHIQLNTNYRSPADILSFVECVCSHPSVRLQHF
ncbi:MAG: UvrD-helicase domain-containing protein, partial [Atopobiaceae bacterium]|nr:UvrD-helicase domain-containing protein [Atopobiaceae bacterium]